MEEVMMVHIPGRTNILNIPLVLAGCNRIEYIKKNSLKTDSRISVDGAPEDCSI